VQCLRIDAYSFEEFVSITISRLKLQKIESELAEDIANKVHEAGSSDVRDCVYIAKMA
jgi:ATP-dependent Clp protease adapter protein ClpS